MIPIYPSIKTEEHDAVNLRFCPRCTSEDVTFMYMGHIKCNNLECQVISHTWFVRMEDTSPIWSSFERIKNTKTNPEPFPLSPAPWGINMPNTPNNIRCCSRCGSKDITIDDMDEGWYKCNNLATCGEVSRTYFMNPNNL